MADDPTTDQAAAEAPDRADSSRRRWLLIGGILVAVLVIGGAAWAVVASRDTDTPSYDTAQIVWMHQGCQQWVASYQGTEEPNAAWCTSMTDWMNQRMGSKASGQGGMMMGPMMWRDPASMRTTCEQWLATGPNDVPRGNDADAWCRQMVEWMDQHMGDWGEWTRNGPMMTGS